MSRTLLMAMIMLFLGASASAQTASSGSATQGVDVTARVDGLFQQWNRTDSPGCAVSVMKDGRIAYTHGYGMADLDHDVRITPSTVFHGASMSKQFTAASIVLLAEQGKLSFNTMGIKEKRAGFSRALSQPRDALGVPVAGAQNDGNYSRFAQKRAARL